MNLIEALANQLANQLARTGITDFLDGAKV